MFINIKNRSIRRLDPQQCSSSSACFGSSITRVSETYMLHGSLYSYREIGLCIPAILLSFDKINRLFEVFIRLWTLLFASINYGSLVRVLVSGLFQKLKLSVLLSLTDFLFLNKLICFISGNYFLMQVYLKETNLFINQLLKIFLLV